MKKRGIFITGTDTGVGKTVVAATLALILRRRGIDVGVLKPVTSGCRQTGIGLVSDDAELLRWAADCTDDAGDTSPYLLEAPLAPSVAAEREGVRIDFSRIREVYELLSSRHDFVIVEGAGGLMVPLAGGLMVADLILYLALPALVVTRPNLGTVNHTVLTTFAARQMGIDVRGTIINNFPDSPDAAEEYAPHLIDSLSGVPLLGVFSRIGEGEPREVVHRLAEETMKKPTLNFLLREIGI